MGWSGFGAGTFLVKIHPPQQVPEGSVVGEGVPGWLYSPLTNRSLTSFSPYNTIGRERKFLFTFGCFFYMH